MAHPCIKCGSECYCSGDIDDAVVSRTPKKCTSCDCDEDYDGDGDDDIVGYECIGCHVSYDSPGVCMFCDNPLDPY
jgi:hypothetical protein